MLVIHVSGYIEQKDGNKYFNFDDSVNENKELLKKHADVWDGIKNEIKSINGGKENDYVQDYMIIKFHSDDHLSWNKPLKFHIMTIIIRSVFEDGGKLWGGIKNEIKSTNGGKENDCIKDYMKVKFNFEDDLSWNKPLKFHITKIITRSVFEDGGKLYPQVFLDDTFYEL